MNKMSNKDWETIFNNWKNPPSDTEEQKCTNAEGMIRDAIRNDPNLSQKDIQIFGHGSYKNNTNVRLESDIDICVRLMDAFYFELPEGKNRSNFGINNLSSYTYSEFKNDVEEALVNKFGNENVVRGNKAFDMNSNTYRVNADVVACFEHRRYTGNGYQYHSGIKFYANDETPIINWPVQHYENGVQKNLDTSKRFKKVVRILKKLNYQMREGGYSVCKRIPSFLIECLVWNVPNNILTNYDNYTDTIQSVLYFLHEHTKNEELCDKWGEVSELMYLFRGHSKWTKKDVTDFTIETSNYLEFG
jgi:hypothetical protein